MIFEASNRVSFSAKVVDSVSFLPKKHESRSFKFTLLHNHRRRGILSSLCPFPLLLQRILVVSKNLTILMIALKFLRLLFSEFFLLFWGAFVSGFMGYVAQSFSLTIIVFNLLDRLCRNFAIIMIPIARKFLWRIALNTYRPFFKALWLTQFLKHIVYRATIYFVFVFFKLLISLYHGATLQLIQRIGF